MCPRWCLERTQELHTRLHVHLSKTSRWSTAIVVHQIQDELWACSLINNSQLIVPALPWRLFSRANPHRLHPCERAPNINAPSIKDVEILCFNWYSKFLPENELCLHMHSTDWRGWLKPAVSIETYHLFYNKVSPLVFHPSLSKPPWSVGCRTMSWEVREGSHRCTVSA